MTTPAAPGGGGPDAPDPRDAPVDLGKSSAPKAEAPFDPYRFGKPDHPVPPEFAPPGYTPPPAGPAGYSPVPQPSPYGEPSPYGQAPSGQSPYGQAPYGQAPYGQSPYGQSPYGRPSDQYPPPYGVPAPPFADGYPRPRTGNGKAIASLVLGILSIVFFVFSVFDAVLIIPALIFGILGLTESKQTGSGRGLAIAGLVCMGVGVVSATIWTFTIVHAANQCGGLTSDTSSTEFQQCVQDHLFGS